MIKSQNHVLQTATFRHKALTQIRKHFNERDFLEIDAPLIVAANAVEAFIDPISINEHDQHGRPNPGKYLITSPEIHMKRLLAHGTERIYFLGHVFRDGESSPVHRTEFLMLEWYEAHANLGDLISGCENLFRDLTRALGGSVTSFDEPFDRISMASAWETFAEIDLETALKKTSEGDRDALAKTVIASGETLRDNADFDDAFTHIMLKKIEPQIGQDKPCVLFDWPAQTAALAQLVPGKPLFAQRFEIYCRGLELANAFTELTDQVEQRARFIEANETRIKNARSQLPIDENFISDLRNMPPASGIAVGIDRLLALILGRKTLQEILCLPD